MIIPPTKAMRMDVCTALRIPSRLACPVLRAMTTLAPMAMPPNMVTMSPMRELLLPTAAMASFPTNRPITAISAALNSCCRIPVAATGSANRMILSPREPWIMSISLD